MKEVIMFIKEKKHMSKISINARQLGFLFKKGKLSKILKPGQYRFMISPILEIVPTDQELCLNYCDINSLLNSQLLQSQVTVIDVPDNHIALVYVDDRFSYFFKSGKHALFNSLGTITYTICDITTPFIKEELSPCVLHYCSFIKKIIVPEGNKGALFVNSAFIKILEAGVYYFWATEDIVTVNMIETRETQAEITGQEVLTLDKVTIRVNLVAFYTVTDFEKMATQTKDPSSQLHIFLQLALREYVGTHKLDEILENKVEMTKVILENIKTKEDKLFIHITSIGVKDIILPGEIRDIMNTVLIAEKKSQANVITRREEVASTRSLLNTARLMEENKTLYKLKELEYLERICEHVGSINVTGSEDVLTQLTNILKK